MSLAPAAPVASTEPVAPLDVDPQVVSATTASTPDTRVEPTLG